MFRTLLSLLILGCSITATAQERISGIESGYGLFSTRRFLFNGGIESGYTGNPFVILTQQRPLDGQGFLMYTFGYTRKGSRITEDQTEAFSRFNYLTMGTFVGKAPGKFEWYFGPEFGYVLWSNVIKDGLKFSSVSGLSSRVDVSLLLSGGLKLGENAIVGARLSQGVITVQQLGIVDANGFPVGTVGTFNRGIQAFARFHFSSSE